MSVKLQRRFSNRKFFHPANWVTCLRSLFHARFRNLTPDQAVLDQHINDLSGKLDVYEQILSKNEYLLGDVSLFLPGNRILPEIGLFFHRKSLSSTFIIFPEDTYSVCQVLKSWSPNRMSLGKNSSMVQVDTDLTLSPPFLRWYKNISSRASWASTAP